MLIIITNIIDRTCVCVRGRVQYVPYVQVHGSQRHSCINKFYIVSDAEILSAELYMEEKQNNDLNLHPGT